MPHGKAQLGGGAAVPEEIHRDAPAAHHVGRLLGVKPGVDPAVIADADALFRQSRLVDHGGKGVGGLSDDVFVHTVETHAHHAAQAGGTKGKGAVESVVDLSVIQGSQFGPLVPGEDGGVQPLLIGNRIHRCRSFRKGHIRTLYYSTDPRLFPPCFSEKCRRGGNGKSSRSVHETATISAKRCAIVRTVEAA